MANVSKEASKRLQQAGLSADESAIYLELLKQPASHLRVSRETGINRTKVYRIVDQLVKQGLIMRRSDDRGVFLTAGDPFLLEDKISAKEKVAAEEREAFEWIKSAMPLLSNSPAADFIVHTYQGEEGMKQMQWHELKTEKELLAFGYITYEELVGSRRWAEDFRCRVAEAGYKIREIVSRLPDSNDLNFTSQEAYLKNYCARQMAGSMLPIYSPMVVFNDTVAIYQVDAKRKFGLEIVNPGFAETMRCIFEGYWALAEPL